MELKIKIYIAAIAETASGDLYNCIVTATSEKELVRKVNEFFKSEEAEGHPVRDSYFESVSEFDGLNTMDDHGDREYDIVACVREVDVMESVREQVRQLCKDDILDFEERSTVAWHIMERDRCPLSWADHRLEQEVKDVIEEWCEDNLNPEDIV